MKSWKAHCKELRKKLWEVLGYFGPRGKVHLVIGDFRHITDKFLLKTIEKSFAYEAAPGGEPRKKLWAPEKSDSFKTFSVKYPGVEGTTVYATLRIPKKLKGKAPAVLCLHGHRGGLWFGKEHTDKEAVLLAEAGFITFSPDALPSGLRRIKSELYDEWEYDAGGMLFWSERLWADHLWAWGKTLIGAQIWEIQRAIDVLELLPEADSRRIAAVGHSQGGVHTDWLMAMDDRIKAGVPCGSLGTYKAFSERRIVHALYSIIPHILEVADMPEIMSMIPPRALFTIEAHYDRVFPIDCQMEICGTLRKKYEEFGAEDKFKNYSVEGEHGDVELPKNIEPIIKFLKMHL